MKKKYIVLLIVIAALVFSASIGGALAYFSTYTTAMGGYPVALDNNPTPEEWYSKDGLKHLIIKNTGDGPIFVRAKAVVTDGVGATPNYQESANWTDKNLGGADGVGYYYYTKALEGKNAETEAETITSELLITITFPKQPKIDGKTEFVKGDEMNVLVLFESVPAMYKADGTEDFELAWTTGPVTVVK